MIRSSVSPKWLTRRRALRTAAVVVAIAVTTSLAACAASPGSTPEATGESGGTVHVLRNGDFSHLDPTMGYDASVFLFYRLIYRTLTTYKAADGPEGAEVVPDLATDLGTASDDAKTWTFTLRDDIFFEDGTPITSADVKFGVERSFDPDLAIGSPYARTYLDNPDGYQGPYVSEGGLDSIETPDDKTIVFHLNQPVGDFANVVAQPIFTPFPADVTKTSVDSEPVASGPYRVEEYDKGSTLALARNDHWSADSDEVRAAHPDAYEFTFGLDNATQDERMLADQGDDKNAVADQIQPATIARLQSPGVEDRTVTSLSGCTRFVGMNLTKPVFADVRVREAVNYATDKASVQAATGGQLMADIARTMLPPSLAGHNDFDLFATKDDAGDPEKAKELLTEAGYPDGISFTLDLPNSPVYIAQAEAFQQSLSKAGITVNLNIIDGATYYEAIGTPSQQNDAALTGWCPDWANGGTFLPPLFDGRNIVEKGNQNIVQLNDPAINDRIDEIKLITDPAEAANAYGDLDEQIMELAPTAPLIHSKSTFVTGSNITDAFSHVNFGGGIDLVSLALKNTSE